MVPKLHFGSYPPSASHIALSVPWRVRAADQTFSVNIKYFIISCICAQKQYVDLQTPELLPKGRQLFLQNELVVIVLHARLSAGMWRSAPTTAGCRQPAAAPRNALYTSTLQLWGAFPWYGTHRGRHLSTPSLPLVPRFWSGCEL